MMTRRGLRMVQAEFRLVILSFAQFRRAESAGREFLEGVEQRLDGGGLRGIGNRPGQKPAAVRALGADFRRVGGMIHLDAGDGGEAQVGQERSRPGYDRTEVVVKNEDEREQRRGDHEPDSGGFGIHDFCSTKMPTKSNRQMTGWEMTNDEALMTKE